MLTDIVTVIWKEWKELLAQRGNFSLQGGGLSLLIIVIVFSVVLPLQMGSEWVKSPILLFFAGWLTFSQVANTVTDAFAGERERHTLETLFASRLPDKAILLGKVCAAMGYGITLVLLIMMFQLVTLNIAYTGNSLLLYPVHIGLGSIVSSLLTGGLAATLGVLISLRAASTRQAQQMMSIIYMVAPFVIGYGVQLLPITWRDSLSQLLAHGNLTHVVWLVGGILMLVDVGLLQWALARFKHTRLLSLK